MLMPVKSPGLAKSRLAPAWDDPYERSRLVQAMRRDTLDAVHGTPGVVGVVAAVDAPHAAHDLGAGLDVVVQAAPGLNAALTEADAFAVSRWPGRGRIAVVGDLPALTPTALAEVLDAAAAHARSFVADLSGSGTTMLAVTVGRLDPRFGAGSAWLHARDAVSLPAAPGARFDVDLPEDLVAAPAVGVGAATREVLAGHHDRVGCPNT